MTKKLARLNVVLTRSKALFNRDPMNPDYIERYETAKNAIVEKETEKRQFQVTVSRRKEQLERNFTNQQYPDPHPCSAVWEEKQVCVDEQYQELLHVQQHKCTPNYCLRRRTNRQTGAEYGDPACRFSYPKDLCRTSRLTFQKVGENGVRASIQTVRNDPRINQHCRFHLNSWYANCDMQIVLDEEQALRYLVKYASKPETRAEHGSNLLKTILNQNKRRNDVAADQEQKGESHDATERSAASLIRQLAIRSIGERDKSHQEVMHALLQESLYHSDFKYVTVVLDKYNVRRIRPNPGEGEPVFYKNIFDYYADRAADNTMSLMQFLKKFTVKKNGCLSSHAQSRRVVIIPYPNYSSEPGSTRFPDYCKYFLIKHRPWWNDISNAWGGDIRRNDLDDHEYNTRIRSKYVAQFEQFKATIDITELEMYNADVERLRRIRRDCAEEQAIRAENVGHDRPLEDWQRFGLITRQIAENDSDSLPSDVLPRMDRSINWLQTRITHENQVLDCDTWLEREKAANPTEQRTINAVTAMLNVEQQFALDLIDLYLTEEKVFRILLTGGPGTGKSLLINAISSHCLERHNTKVLRLATTGPAAFGIGGSTVHSVLSLPINCAYKPLKGSHLQMKQVRLKDTRVIILDEVSMLGAKTLIAIDKRLREISGNGDVVYGGFCILFVGDFQQLPPVGDKPIYDPSNPVACALFNSFDDTICLSVSERQAAARDTSVHACTFKQFLVNCERGTVTEQDWHNLKQRYPQNVPDRESDCWTNAARLFFDNASAQEHNISRLQSLGSPIAHLKAEHDCVASRKRDSSDAGGLKNDIYLAVGAKVMLTSNLWTEIGLHNGAMGVVVDIIYEDSVGPTNGSLPKAVVVQFPDLDDSIPCFLPDVQKTVSIPVVSRTWIGANFKEHYRKQVPLILAWAFTIHKSQGKTLDYAVIDLGKSEKVSGLTLVAVSRVRAWNNFLVQPHTLSRLLKINKDGVRVIQELVLDLKRKATECRDKYIHL